MPDWYQAFYLTPVHLFLQTHHLAFESWVRFPSSRPNSATHWLNLCLSLSSALFPSRLHHAQNSHLKTKVFFLSPVSLPATVLPLWPDCMTALSAVALTCSPLSLTQRSSATPPQILNGLESCGSGLSCFWIKLFQKKNSFLLFIIQYNKYILESRPSAKVKVKR